MSRFFQLGGTLAIALLLVGAGCNTTENTATSDDTTAKKDTTSTTEVMEKKTSDDTDDTNEMEYVTKGDGVIELKATAVGTRQVKFEWELSKAVNEPTHFILLRGDNAELIHDQKTFWFRQHGTKRAATWVNLPPGEQFFRLCASNDKETCDIYSDTLKVDVLSGPIRPPKKVEEIAETETEEVVEEEVTEEVVEEETEETPTESTEAENEGEDDSVMEDTSSTSTEDVVLEEVATSTEDVVIDSSTSTESGTNTLTTTEDVVMETPTTTEL